MWGHPSARQSPPQCAAAEPQALLLVEHFQQRLNQQINLVLLQTQRWQQPQNLRIARRARNDLLCEQRSMNFLRAVREFKSKQKTAAVNIQDLLDFFQTLAQIRLNRSHVCE